MDNEQPINCVIVIPDPFEEAIDAFSEPGRNKRRRNLFMLRDLARSRIALYSPDDTKDPIQ